MASVAGSMNIVNQIADLRMQHNPYCFNVLYACVVRSEGDAKIYQILCVN